MSELAADWHELVTLQCIMHASASPDPTVLNKCFVLSLLTTLVVQVKQSVRCVSVCPDNNFLVQKLLSGSFELNNL